MSGQYTRAPAALTSIILRSFFPLPVLICHASRTALPFGDAGAEKVSLNIDSLWSGGPFEVSNYTGGNPTSEKFRFLPGCREWIFENGTGNITELLGSNDNYGSYRVLGNLSVTIDGLADVSSYNRSLDLNTGVHTTSFQSGDGSAFTTSVYCSFPDQVCVYSLNSTDVLPDVTISLENQQAASDPQNATCGAGYVRFTGLTQAGPPEGMKYDAIARLVGSNANMTVCSNSTSGALLVPSGRNSTYIVVVLAAGTNYDQKKGNAENNYSFKGEDPGPEVEATVVAAASNAESLLSRHLEDYQRLAQAFVLDLPDTLGSASLETSEAIARYNTSTDYGDPFVENLIFDYSRHLLITSARPGVLPANLQGKWSQTLYGAWSVDYHANINIQMNYWHADQTGLGELQGGLWDYMADTWVPRGTETAHMLYGAPGWVTHNEMNIFGHTGMKSDAGWANYPASAAWMMQHVYDHYEYSGDDSWYVAQGYPLIKGVAQFWLSQLQPDARFADGTLVVNPCNSPEHGPTTFACTHYQQLLHQLLAYVLDAGARGVETDAPFLANASAALARLDTGLHFTAWGGVAEWKLQDAGWDVEGDTHRHLSNLYGWFPGYSIAGTAATFPSNTSSNISSSPAPNSTTNSSPQPFHPGYTNATIRAAVSTSLLSRGNGTGPDADAGWAKVWRAACWARLNDAAKAYDELRYAVARNFAPNALSMYSAHETPFQIDANFGWEWCG
ncbi:Six-hairpin glycosidase-like protein [Macrophomina phaseolina MS6]|uniref:Six-hairpin glycosidase-like protein n=1 Tax=Macrophomina phaseolina (strain MS6) TaxID=1126212 RepID=K2RS97_MACPH|nr:Six-hairpin glycosidase-like protein [Macrophomina phaseolina MS6]